MLPDDPTEAVSMADLAWSAGCCYAAAREHVLRLISEGRAVCLSDDLPRLYYSKEAQRELVGR